LKGGGGSQQLISVCCSFADEIGSALTTVTNFADECQRALGMESGRIADRDITASSSFDQLSTGAINSR
jgi:hypothetical protein